jgi:hypothetical protein
MIDFNKPHMVPQTTKSLASGAEGQRQKQIGAYEKDKAHNQTQMDSIRHSQYHKQNSAVNKQKSRMSDNASKSSKAITGSSNFYKEEAKTFEDFLAEAEQKLVAPSRPATSERYPHPKGFESKAPRLGKKKKEKGGALVKSGSSAIEKDVIDVDVKDVTDDDEKKKKKLDDILGKKKEKEKEDETAEEEGETPSEEKKKEKEKEKMRTAGGGRGSGSGRRRSRRGGDNLLKKGLRAAGRFVKDRVREGGPTISPGSASFQRNTATMARD